MGGFGEKKFFGDFVREKKISDTFATFPLEYHYVILYFTITIKIYTLNKLG